MDILAAMAEMRAMALQNGRIPLRWEINQAGLDVLKARNEMTRDDLRFPFIDLPVFGIRMALVYDLSPDPRVWLIVEEAWRRRRNYTALTAPRKQP